MLPECPRVLWRLLWSPSSAAFSYKNVLTAANHLGAAVCSVAEAEAVPSPKVSVRADDMKLRKFLPHFPREAVGLKKQTLNYAETDPATEYLICCSSEFYVLVKKKLFLFL